MSVLRCLLLSAKSRRSFPKRAVCDCGWWMQFNLQLQYVSVRKKCLVGACAFKSSCLIFSRPKTKSGLFFRDKLAMLQQIWTAATDLPVVTQGALGSGLFAFALWFGQRLVAYASERYARSSIDRRKIYLTNEISKLHIQVTNDYSQRSAYLGLLIYRALRSLFKALIWITLGLLFQSFEPILGVVGYLGAMYHFFNGLNIVRSSTNIEDKKAVLKTLSDELASLNKA